MMRSALVWLWIFVGFLCSVLGENVDHDESLNKCAGSFGYELIDFRIEDLAIRLSEMIDSIGKNHIATYKMIDELAASVATINRRNDNLAIDIARSEAKIEAINSKLSAGLEPVRKTLESNLNEINSKISRLMDQIIDLEETGDSILSKQRWAENKINDINTSISTLNSQSKQILKNHFDLVIPSCRFPKLPGIYRLQVPNINVLCETTILGGGWLVIQLRFTGEQSFYKGWYDYRAGFGTIGFYTDFWLGLEAIHQITNSGDYELQIDVRNETKVELYARYSQFKISSENDGYRLTIGGYSGTAGDSLSYSNNMKFSTFSIDNDLNSKHNCALHNQSGWWFKNCANSDLNGPYEKASNGYGIHWGTWTKAGTYSRMMIRRK